MLETSGAPPVEAAVPPLVAVVVPPPPPHAAAERANAASKRTRDFRMAFSFEAGGRRIYHPVASHSKRERA
jgi:hypothetical protein